MESSIAVVMSVLSVSWMLVLIGARIFLIREEVSATM
jgi:hypothetical protein